MFRKVLIANRGEIAVRVARTLREMGVTPVAVHSDPDRDAAHVGACREAYRLPGTTSAETYLQAGAVIDIARACGADAIHPGYGFLSENASFAEACAEAGITFIGPSPEAIRTMGDKIVAKEAMKRAGVPILEGVSIEGAMDDDAVRALAAGVGYPLLVKAAAGGGGKGMRVVHEEDAFDEALAAARREAKAAFGDDRVFFERFVERARHVEFQVFGDTHGNVVHLAERECSIQRRHQKIIEEAPSPALTDDLRAQMGAAAVEAARTIGYTNAGTVEFMLDDQSGSFWFLEVNTRLQVEHPVTEMVVQRDLVRDQLRVAAGEPLGYTQDDVRIEGHAIECRVYAEDPDRGYLPSTGRIAAYVEPSGPGVRVDSGVYAGADVTVHYDPMLAKAIVWATTRDEAIARMRRVLHDYVVLGVTTNLPFLGRVLAHPAFVAGDLTTRFLEQHEIAVPPDVPVEAFLAAAAALAAPTVAASVTTDAAPGPWDAERAWRVG